MAWTAMPAFVAGAQLTAAQLMVLVGNINETAAAKVTAAGQYVVGTAANTLAVRTPTVNSVSSAATVTSASYVAPSDGLGPVVTGVTTGTRALVIVSARLSGTAFSDVFASYAVSGATTDAAADNRAFQANITSTTSYRGSAVIVHDLLTPGSNTFAMQYRTTAPTATLTSRQLNVLAY